MIIDRVWAMPNCRTFSIKPVAELIEMYRPEEISIDPFSNNARLADITNDLNPDCESDFHLDAKDFLEQFEDESISMVLYDPPYSPRQVSECYKHFGYTVNMETTQSSYWKKHKEQISRIVRAGGIVIACGWNSGGIGAKYGFEKEHIRLIPHGGNHNDTIIVVERKRGEKNAV